MRLKPLHWCLISLLLFAAAICTWRYADKLAQREAGQKSISASKLNASHAQHPPLIQTAATKPVAKRKTYRLSNTSQSIAQLLHNRHAIILRNALIDTEIPVALDIPAHLRAKGAPGSYLVQADRPLDKDFYAELSQAGATYISYVPNDTALVKATPSQATNLSELADVIAVLPYEPYYKLDSTLLPPAVDQQPETNALNLSVTTFPGQRDAALAELTQLGAKFMGEDRSPFGPTLMVSVPPESLVAVAQLPLAQEIETYTPRRVMNDLTRVIMGVASNTLRGTPNYLNLTGSQVTVNINDTGVDSTHPDFSPSARLRADYPSSLIDYDGHGTHVAGIIAGNGQESATVTGFVPGSIIPGADFRGKATNATLFVQSLDLNYGPFISDSFLQENASSNLGSTNLISNNSWGYDSSTYDIHAASYDAATRDAQPNVDGEQPLLFVFAAGNGGNGSDNGVDGSAGTITSPGTAKNVITVGASDSPRFITNMVSYDGVTTNEVFYGSTDNSNLVAYFSSCGNVDAGVEGTYGRFKPDVVAPGVFTISCRSTNYIDPTNETIVNENPFPNQIVLPKQTNVYPFSIPYPLEGFSPSSLVVIISSNAASPVPFPTNMQILADMFEPPTDLVSSNNFYTMTNLNPGDLWFFGVAPPTNSPGPVNYDITFYLYETNYEGDYFTVLSNMNSVLRPYYVYGSGTSMSAGDISGMLALMQEYLQSKTPFTNPSPALLKAMLINGSRSLGPQYDFNVQTEGANEQGWGLPNLTNCIPGSLTNAINSLVMVDQSSSNALSTGQYQSYTINCSDTNATTYPMRFTLVWTDPPGDPAAGIALVNNLDLTVSDSTGSNIYIGNNFDSGDIFTEVSNPTNLPAGQSDNTIENVFVNNNNLPIYTTAGDPINNVQNVYINPANGPISFPLTVTISGTRINVNAVTTQTNNILQDFALVISSDAPSLTSSLALGTNGIVTNLTPVLITVASNGVPLLHERVGANEPNLYNYPAGQTNGNFSQWHFFIFTNNQFSATNDATNVAFATFLPPNLSIPRASGSADIDLYSSTDPNLTNLLPSAVEAAQKSLSRTGTETIIYSNSSPNLVYYIGVKSEDQQASDFGFYGIAQQAPFSTLSSDGNNVTATGTSLPVFIPNALSTEPALVFAFLFNPNPLLQDVRRVTVTLGIQHPSPDDLSGTIQHNGTTVYLNHNSTTLPSNGFTNTYDDLQEDPNSGDITSDGVPPDTLAAFASQPADGLWLLTEADNFTDELTGYVTTYTVSVDLHQPATAGFYITIPGQSWFDDYVDVPNDTTNMLITALYENYGTNLAGTGPIGIYCTNVAGPIYNTDYGTNGIVPPGGYLALSTNSPVPGFPSAPPLAGGFWYYGIYNSNTQPVSLFVQVFFEESLTPNLVQTYSNNVVTPLTTDGHTQSLICITNSQQIVSLQVGLAVNDTNLDDLVIHLTSPEGTSVNLFEDRGGLAATNLGLEQVTNVVTGTGTNLSTNSVTNIVYTVFTENTNLTTTPIKFGPPPYATNIVIPLEVLWTNSWETVTNGIYTNNNSNAIVLEGWLVTNNVITVQMTNGPTLFTNNEVGIVTDPYGDLPDTNLPGSNFLGTNYLALTSGRIIQTFGGTNTTAFTNYSKVVNTISITNGMPYQLQFYVKPLGIVDWWPGDDNAHDIIGTNNGMISILTNYTTNTAVTPNVVTTNIMPLVMYDSGEVGRAFTFSGATNSFVSFTTNSGYINTNDFTIDFWIKTSEPSNNIGADIVGMSNSVNPSSNYFGILLTNGAILYQESSNNIASSPFTLLTATNVSVNDGQIFHHVAITRQTNLVSIYIDGILNTNAFDGEISSITNTNGLVAGAFADTNTCQSLAGDLDELDLFNRALSPAEIQAIYTAGSLGKYNTNSLLPNFQLTIDGVSTNTIVLTNASEGWQLITNSFIATNSQVTVEFAGNTMGVLLDDISLIQLPATNYDNYYLPEEPLSPLVGENPLGCWTLDVWDTRNDSPLPTNGTLLSWTLQLTTSSTNAVLYVLTNDVPMRTNVSTNSIAYFAVDVPSYAHYATNILTNISGGGPLTLFFNQNALPTGGLPGDYTLTNGVASGEVSTNTLAVAGGLPPLIPGQRYFLGVENNGPEPVTFSIQVDFDGVTNIIIPLTNQIPYTNVVGTNTIGTNGPEYYSFTITNTNAVMVTFQILDATNGEVDLYAREGMPVPGPLSFDYASRNSCSNDQFIVVTTNSVPVPLPVQSTNALFPLTPTTWYLAAYNFAEVSNINYSIVATVVTNGGMDIISLTNAKAYTNTAPPGYPTNLLYSFTVTNNPPGIEFTVTNLTNAGNVQLLSSLDVYPTPQESYAGSYNSGTNAQTIYVFVNPGLTNLNGTWYLSVPNTSGTNVPYTITATTNVIGPLTIIPLTWSGAVDANWDIFETSNWLATANLTQGYLYQNGSAVTFDTTAPSSKRTVNLTTALSPLSVLINGPGYLFNGSGSIIGAPLTNAGGSLIIDNLGNNFSTVTLTGGTLQIGNNDARGSLFASGGILGSAPFTDGGTLAFDRTDNIQITNIITGSGGFSQLGSGVLSLSGSNSYAGSTAISSGALIVDNTNALGAIPGGAVVINNGGALDLGGLPGGLVNPLFGAKAFEIAGVGVGGNGAIVNNGVTAQEGGLVNISLTASATIGGSNRWDMRNGAAATSLNLGGYTLTKTDSNQISFVSPSVPTAGNIVINQGILSIEAAPNFANPTQTPITVNSNGLLGQNLDTLGSLTAPIILNGGGITNLSGSGVSYVDGSITLSNNAWFGNGGGIAIFDGVVSGPFALTNLGVGSNYLSATNTYTGSTLIAQGTFGLSGNGSIANSTNIFVYTNATLDATRRVDQSFLVASNQILFANGTVLASNVEAGPGSILYGAGIINTNLTLDANSLFSPGPDGVTIGALTVSNIVTLNGASLMKINELLSPSNDMVATSNLVVYGGTLTVTNLDANLATTFVLGDSFLLYNASNSAGVFAATNLPPLPARLMWSNTFGISGPGIITVVANTNYVPPFPIIPLTWNGAAAGVTNGYWGILTPSNWMVTTNFATPYAYQDGSVVTFDTNASGTRTVILTNALSPTSVTVTNGDLIPYIFTGPGGINGASLLVNGALIIDNATNNFPSVTFIGGSLQIGNNDTNGSLATVGGILGQGTFTNGGYLVFDMTNDVIVTNAMTGPGGLSQIGSGFVTLTGANTYTNTTSVSNGTLALGYGGSIGASAVTVSSGATLASISASLVNIGGATTLNSGALASFLAISQVIGTIDVASNLALNGNAVTITVLASPLAVGDYRLINCAGALTGAAGAVTIAGLGLPDGSAASLVTTAGVGGHVDLIITGAPTFSNLIATPTIVYGASSLTLTGTLSAAGPATIYAPSNDVVSATINGATVNGTIIDNTGDFSIAYNDPSLATDGVANSPYPITYSYAGDSSVLLGGATNVSTSLTVTPLPVVLTGARPADGTAIANYSILSVANAINSDVVTVASGSGALASSNVGPEAITSFGSLALGGPAAANYTLTGGSGSVMITSPLTIVITSVSVDPTGKFITVVWQSTAGVVYQVIATTNIAAPLNLWTNIGSPVTATNTTASETFPITQPLDFFEVETGGANSLPPTFSITSEHLDPTGSNIVITWQSISNVIYQVIGNTNVGAPIGEWTNVGGPITATNSTTSATNPLTEPWDFLRVESP